MAYDPALLKNLRSERGLTVADVARRSGLSPFCVGNLEKKTSATPDALRRVARVYGVPVEELAPALASEAEVS